GAFRDAHRATSLVAAAMSGADVNAGLMARRAREHWITITELADTLTRERGLPFKQSHAIAKRLIAASATNPARPAADVLAEVSAEVTGTAIRYAGAQLDELLSPEHFVRVRATWGGPAPEETARAIGVEREGVDRDAHWLAGARQGLDRAAAALKARAAEL
nr:hypothetical protein [Vicinamibacterales bacterium]